MLPPGCNETWKIKIPEYDILYIYIYMYICDFTGGNVHFNRISHCTFDYKYHMVSWFPRNIIYKSWVVNIHAGLQEGNAHILTYSPFNHHSIS